MEMKNVLDQLKAIAENGNQSEDVARAINTVNKHQRPAVASFKDRLAEAEKKAVEEDDVEEGNEFSGALAAAKAKGEKKFKVGSKEYTVEYIVRESDNASVYGEDSGSKPDYIDADGDGDKSEPMKKAFKDKQVDETPGDDDQYCAACGNTGSDLSTGDACSNGCGNEMEYGDSAEGHSYDATGAGTGEGDTVIDGVDNAFGNIHARVQARNGGEDDLGQDPWGIGDGDEAVEETEQEGSAVDRVQQRAQRSGEGGPLDRLRAKKEEKYSALEEEMGKVFQTPMERHQWIMQQLSSMTGDMSPEDAQMVKRLMKTAGEAQVKGGNC